MEVEVSFSSLEERLKGFEELFKYRYTKLFMLVKVFCVDCYLSICLSNKFYASHPQSNVKLLHTDYYV